jgi:hypothetical protein
MFIKIKAAVSKAIPTVGLKLHSAKEGLLYEGQTMSWLTKVTQDVDEIRTLRFGQHGPRQSVVKVGDPAVFKSPISIDPQ